MTPEQSFTDFAAVINGRVPFGYSVDLHENDVTKRGICGVHGRVVVSRQGVCPFCGGYVHDADEVERMRELALRFDLKSQPSHAVKAAAAKFMEEIRNG